MPKLGQFDVHEIAQRGLRVIGDADRDAAVLFPTQPFVFLRVLQISRHFTHRGSPRGCVLRYRA